MFLVLRLANDGNRPDFRHFLIIETW
jgi:hypothetical protein